MDTLNAINTQPSTEQWAEEKEQLFALVNRSEEELNSQDSDMYSLGRMESNLHDFDDLDLESETSAEEKLSPEQSKLKSRIEKLNYGSYFTPKDTILDIKVDLSIDTCFVIVMNSDNSKKLYELSLKQTDVIFQQSALLKKIQFYTRGLEFVDYYEKTIHHRVLSCIASRKSDDMSCIMYIIDPKISNFKGFETDINVNVTLNLQATICLRFIMQIKDFAMSQLPIFDRPKK